MAIQRKPKLTPEVAAALRENGLDPETAVQTDAGGEGDGDDDGDKPEVTATTTDTVVATDTPAPEANTTTTDTPAPKTVVPPVVQAGDDTALVTHLKGELTGVRTELSTALASVTQLTADLSRVNTQLTEKTTAVGQLDLALRVACDRMCPALGSNPSDHANLSGEALAARYTQLRADFDKKYVPGTKSSPNAVVPSGNDTTKNTDAAPAARAAAVQATRPSTK